MSRQLEQAISNLIPRYSGTLPPELVDLASSLLARSRTKCTLKADEDVARTYICANLACERLKTALNLPPIEPRPPIPPKLYSKVYAYFDRELAASRSRPKPNTTPKATPTKPLPQRHTPSKDKSLEGFRANRTPRKGLQHLTKTEKEAKIPKWAPPSIRLLCKELETPRAIPHVLAGVESILCIPPPAGGGVQVEGRMPALIAAVWFFVVTRMRGPEKQGMENMARKTKVREVLAEARENASVLKRVGKEDEDWAGWEVVKEKDVNEWRKEILRGEWKGLDWYLNIEEGVGVEGEVEEEDGRSEGGEDEEMRDGTNPKKRKIRIDRYDYLSEENRREYAQWKSMICAKIDELIAGGILDDSTDEMDTREG